MNIVDELNNEFSKQKVRDYYYLKLIYFLIKYFSKFHKENESTS